MVTRQLKNGRSLVPRHVVWLTVAVVAGCWGHDDRPTVVVYTALDREFSQPIFDDFQRETGIRVLAKYDTESTKTVGLANAILAEANRPRCDVFWNNEILNTLRLQKAELLEPFQPDAADEFPASYRSSTGKWHGFAARARVLLVNDDIVSQDDRPASILELAAPRWRGQVGMAKPLFGTTATHAAVLFERWGTERATEFFTQVHDHVQILSGNKQVALAVANGRLAWGITDTDDAIIEVEKGMPVSIVYPDQHTEGIGTLFIPNTLGIIAGGPHPESSRRLVNYLLSEGVERRLAAGPSAQIPLRTTLEMEPRVETPKTVKAMEVDFDAAADRWEEAREFLQSTFFHG